MVFFAIGIFMRKYPSFLLLDSLLVVWQGCGQQSSERHFINLLHGLFGFFTLRTFFGAYGGSDTRRYYRKKNKKIPRNPKISRIFFIKSPLSSILFSAASPAVFFRTCRPCRGLTHKASPPPDCAPLTFRLSGVNKISPLRGEIFPLIDWLP